MLSPTAGWRMAAAKLILLSCLVAFLDILPTRSYRLTRSVWPRKFIYQPSGLVCSRKCSTILNFPSSNYLSIPFHNREVSFVYYLPNLVLISLILLMPCGFQKPRCRCKFSLLLSLVRVRRKNKISVTRIWNAWLHMKNFCGLGISTF